MGITTRLYVLTLMIVIVCQLTLLPVDSARISDYPDPTVPEAIKAAMTKCGPNYQYRLMADDTLEVNRGGGWEKLRY
ncbi:MAG: hypothetical protein J7M30_02145 [Deltaproteobacteria bacterium]|nr:hypothetical protein [Deltaproteobacteria bacterium]